MYFETKLVILRFNLKTKELKHTSHQATNCLMDIYSCDAQMRKALEKYFAASPMECFDRIANRGAIASMNAIQTRWAWDGDRLYDWVQNGILHTLRINREVNDMVVTRNVKDE